MSRDDVFIPCGPVVTKKKSTRVASTHVQPPSPQALGGSTDAALVLLYPPGLDMGRRWPLGSLTSIGRGLDSTIMVDRESVSRLHAAIYHENNSWWIRDLGSTNGTIVGDKAIEGNKTVLIDGDVLKIGSVIFKFLQGGGAEHAYHEAIYRMTIEDTLTEVANKRMFMQTLNRELCRAEITERPVSLALIDIDDFRFINENHGQLTGDFCLRLLASRWKELVGEPNLLARYGGEEFALLMPEADAHLARALSNVLCERAPIPMAYEGDRFFVTVSMGIATITATEQEETALLAARLLRQADEALWTAKMRGKNRVVHRDEFGQGGRPPPTGAYIHGTPIHPLSSFRAQLKGNTGALVMAGFASQEAEQPSSDHERALATTQLRAAVARLDDTLAVTSEGSAAIIAHVGKPRDDFFERIDKAIYRTPEVRALSIGPLVVSDCISIGTMEDPVQLVAANFARHRQHASSPHSLPLPIGWALRRARAEAEPLPQAMAIIRCTEVVVRWLLAIVASEHKRLGLRTTAERPHSTALERGKLSIGSWAILLREASTRLSGEADLVFPELSETLDLEGDRGKSLFGWLQDFVPLRNKLAHHADATLLASTIVARLPELEGLLEGPLGLIQRMRPAYVESVEMDNEPDEGEDVLVYRVRWLTGEHGVVPLQTWRSTNKLRRGVYLVDRSTDRVLSLSPWIICEHGELAGIREAFFLDRLNKGKPIYKSLRNDSEIKAPSQQIELQVERLRQNW